MRWHATGESYSLASLADPVHMVPMLAAALQRGHCCGWTA